MHYSQGISVIPRVVSFPLLLVGSTVTTPPVPGRVPPAHALRWELTFIQG